MMVYPQEDLQTQALIKFRETTIQLVIGETMLRTLNFTR